MNKIFNDNNLNILPTLNENLIDLTFTSPPYFNVKNYSYYETYETYMNFLEKVFKEIYRITKEGRFCIINTSPILIPRKSRNDKSIRLPIPYDLNTIMQNIGWEFIDDIIWVKPNESVKNRNGQFFQNRLPLMYKPNAITENIMVYRKKTNKLIDWNLKQYTKENKLNSKILNDYEKTNIWYLKPEKHKIHPAIFPQELSDKIISYYSFIDDIILDPFAGIGTVGNSCKKLKRNYILIEKEEIYIKNFIF